MFTYNELVSLEEMLHGKVVKEKVLNQELEYFVRQLEGVVRVDEDILDDLIQELGGWRGAECVDGQLGGGGVGERPVHRGDGGGHAKDEDEGQPRISLDQGDEVSQGCARAGLEVLENDHKWRPRLRVTRRMLVTIPLVQRGEAGVRLLYGDGLIIFGEVEDNSLDQGLDVEAGPEDRDIRGDGAKLADEVVKYLEKM